MLDCMGRQRPCISSIDDRSLRPQRTRTPTAQIGPGQLPGNYGNSLSGHTNRHEPATYTAHPAATEKPDKASSKPEARK
jgi:hypothetical protein